MTATCIALTLCFAIRLFNTTSVQGYDCYGFNLCCYSFAQYNYVGETHTLIVDEDCDEMVAMFHVTGALIYVDPDSGEVTGYDDVFTKLEKAREWYEQCGLGRDYADQFIR